MRVIFALVVAVVLLLELMNVSSNNKQQLLLIVNFSETKRSNERIRMSSFPNDFDQIRSELLSTLNIREDYSMEILNENTGRYYEPALSDKVDPSTRVIQVFIRVTEKVAGQHLMIEGRQFDSNGGFSIAHTPLHIAEITECGRAALGTGVNTWDGAVVLAKFFENNPDIVRGKRILELGAGTGVAGLSTALLGAQHVLLSDLEYVLPNLKENVRKNTFPNATVEVQKVDWLDVTSYPTSDSSTTWDLVIGADVVWLEHLVPPLVQVMVACMRDSSTFYIAHQKRSERTDALLFSMLEKHFTISEVPRESVHPSYRHEKIKIFFGCKRNTS